MRDNDKCNKLGKSQQSSFPSSLRGVLYIFGAGLISRGFKSVICGVLAGWLDDLRRENVTDMTKNNSLE